MIFHKGHIAQVTVGDCRESMRKIAISGIRARTCVTSPPYFGLRDYGHEGQLGLEHTPEAYIAEMVDVFRAVRDVLADDGTLWVNIGDSYARNPSKGTAGTPNGRNAAEQGCIGGAGIPAGLKEKDLVGIPWMLAFALRADGWYLRQEIIWAKPNPMPESVTDRCTKSHESLFLFAKSPRYYFDHEAIKEPAVGGLAGNTKPTKGARQRESVKRGGFDGKTNALPGREAFRAVTETRNKRDVWTIATRPYAGAHFATFPPALVEPCILAGSAPGDIVLDPFGGSGTTAGVALRHGRHAVMCELNQEYAALIPDRIRSICK